MGIFNSNKRGPERWRTVFPGSYRWCVPHSFLCFQLLYLGVAAVQTNNRGPCGPKNGGLVTNMSISMGKKHDYPLELARYSLYSTNIIPWNFWSWNVHLNTWNFYMICVIVDISSTMDFVGKYGLVSKWGILWYATNIQMQIWWFYDHDE